MPIDISDRYRAHLKNTKLSSMGPGLVGLSYSFRGNPQKELALILTPSLADCVLLPNNALCYRNFLRGGMKSFSRGLTSAGPFYGETIFDEHIDKVDRRKIQLTPSFSSDENFYSLLIACNSPYFKDAINEMNRALSNASFNVEKSTWEDYKTWEIKKIIEVFPNED